LLSYGFELPEDFDYKAYNSFLSKYTPVLSRRKKKWEALRTKSGRIPSTGRKIKRFIRKGIPRDFRAEVWMSVSGAEWKMIDKPDYYEEMLKKPNDPDVLQRIELDILRTFPENSHFQEGGNGQLTVHLKNVLAAYANHQTNIGYCQGINFIAGMLLLVTGSEVQSFWLLDSLLGNKVPSTYYTAGMTGLEVDHFVLQTLLQSVPWNGLLLLSVRCCYCACRKRTPRFLERLKQLNIDIQVMTSRWFICLFVDALPVETLFRVWDCLFLEGDKILFRVAVTLIMQYEETLLSQSSFIQFMKAFKDIAKGYNVVDCHRFIKDVFTIPGSFPHRQIAQARAAGRSQAANR
jgi:hypothetical protein